MPGVRQRSLDHPDRARDALDIRYRHGPEIPAVEAARIVPREQPYRARRHPVGARRDRPQSAAGAVLFERFAVRYRLPVHGDAASSDRDQVAGYCRHRLNHRLTTAGASTGWNVAAPRRLADGGAVGRTDADDLAS